MLKPTTASELRNVLAESVKRFKFVKLNGEVREALGTRDVKLISKNVTAPKFIEDVSEKSIVYWDLEEEDFRSVSMKSFVGIY
jgi:hypothetical protein